MKLRVIIKKLFTKKGVLNKYIYTHRYRTVAEVIGHISGSQRKKIGCS